MKRIHFILAVSALTLAAAGCTDSERARKAATFGDQPADIACWTYGTETFRGRSTGKVEYDEGGRISFVDAANGRLTTVDGECRVTYLGDDPEAPEAPVPPVAPVTPVAPASPAAVE